jgi:uncharacterized protein (DUF2062 family)
MSRKIFSKWLPSRESLEKVRHLRVLGPLLARPWLWHLNRRSVAVGLAAGVFIGFIIPMGLQIPFAAVAAFWVRGNLAAAALSTLVTNPFTVAPIYYLAYRLGTFLMGAEPVAWSSDLPVMAKLASVGGPLILGLVVLGIVGGTVAYFGTHALWRLFAARAWQQRLRARADRRRAAGAALSPAVVERSRPPR